MICRIQAWRGADDRAEGVADDDVVHAGVREGRARDDEVRGGLARERDAVEAPLVEERREPDGRDGEFGAFAVDDGLAVRIDDDLRREARADGKRVRGGRSGDCCGQGEAGDSHGLELRRLPVSAQLARDVAAHRPDRAVGSLEQRVEFPGGGVDDVAGDERGRVARGGVAEAELAVVVEPHAPERAVALGEEGVAVPGRDSRDVLGDTTSFLRLEACRRRAGRGRCRHRQSEPSSLTKSEWAPPAAMATARCATSVA